MFLTVSSRLRGARIISAVALIATQLALPSHAAAASFHAYSEAWELTAGSGYSGLSVFRNDAPTSGIPADGCSAPITGSPVYQTEWLVFASKMNWIELGTGQQCQDTYNYWFGGYGYNGTFNLIWDHTGIALNGPHTFTINGTISSGNFVHLLQIDGITKTSVTWNVTGVKVVAGLESYASGASECSWDQNLAYQRNESSTWSAWSSRDGQEIDASMAGGWKSDTTWMAAENTTC